MFIFFSGLDKGKCTDEDLEKAKSMVPKAMEKYVLRKYKSNLFYLKIF